MAVDPIPSSAQHAASPKSPRITREVWQQLRQSHPQLFAAMAAAHRSDDRWVTLDTLPDETKRWLWENIRRWHPDLAELLTSEAMLEMKRVFNGEVMITLDDVRSVATKALTQHAP